MTHRPSIIDLFSDFVENYLSEPSIIINSFQSVLSNGVYTITLEVCEPYYAQPGFNVTIDGNEYEITLVSNTQIKVEGAVAIALTAPFTFDLYPLYFFHGTPRDTNTEITKIKNAADKTPMVWLLEIFDEKFNDEQSESVHVLESSPRLFFLTQSDFSKYTSDDFQERAIKPMRRLMEYFIEELKQYPHTKNFDMTDFAPSPIKSYPRFGVYITNKGVDKSMFADDLTGVELPATYLIYSQQCVTCP
jgi:hypothetical protein